mmetsp:Transcript_26510/g.52804  ORF Transcript_26510/g.52804 Transcript_26510/m.52804 type:complete len:189 (-) Transcript_26510:97-663(-)
MIHVLVKACVAFANKKLKHKILFHRRRRTRQPASDSKKPMTLAKNWNPERHPELWLSINAVCLASSIVVLADTIVAESTLSERPFAMGLYILWNFVTTTVWCAEAALQKFDPCSDNSKWAREEWALVAYFIIDSMCLSVRLRNSSNVEGRMENIIISCLAYAVMLSMNYKSLAAAERRRWKVVSVVVV